MGRKTETIVLYSDGGGEKDSAAAGGCIVEASSGDAKIALSVFLGGATNNEAEISAALLGFSLIQHFRQVDALKGESVKWVCDSQYVLKSATEYIHTWQRNGWKTANRKPVKNQGLWRAYLALSSDLEIRPMHVHGHTGHPENEACDAASSWARDFGEEFLVRKGEGVVPELAGTGGFEKWFLLDGREFLENMREEHPEEGDFMGLLERLFDIGVNSFDPREVIRQRKRLASQGELFACGDGAEDIEPLLHDLREIAEKAGNLGDSSARALALRTALERLLKRF